MSRVESFAKPVLLQFIEAPSVSCRLNLEQLLPLAVWLTVKAIVLDQHALGYGRTEPFFSHHARRALLEECIPLTNSEIWIGRLTPPTRRASGRTSIVYSSVIPEDLDAPLRVCAATIGVNEFVMQLRAVTSIGRPPVDPSSVPFYRHPLNGIWSDYLIEIWPGIRDQTDWPPRAVLPARSFYSLAYRVVSSGYARVP